MNRFREEPEAPLTTCLSLQALTKRTACYQIVLLGRAKKFTFICTHPVSPSQRNHATTLPCTTSPWSLMGGFPFFFYGSTELVCWAAIPEGLQDVHSFPLCKGPARRRGCQGRGRQIYHAEESIKALVDSDRTHALKYAHRFSQNVDGSSQQRH